MGLWPTYFVNQFSSVTQSCPTLCDLMDCSTPGLPVITNSQSWLKLMSIESVMPSNHLILCHPLLLPPSIFPSIRVLSNESALCIGGQSSWTQEQILNWISALYPKPKNNHLAQPWWANRPWCMSGNSFAILKRKAKSIFCWHQDYRTFSENDNK